VKLKHFSATCGIAVASTTCAMLFMLPRSSAQTEKRRETPKKGTIEKIKVHGKSLEGNLEGDSADRDVFVYLPPSYASNRNRRYPVVYFLHGYGVKAEMYWNLMTVPDAADAAIADGSAHEMILVHPDAFTIYSGSMYSNSLTTGDWEDFIAKDLIAYIDSHYRTIADRRSRGLAGHSMGGYGTVRIGMKHPEAFSALYAMSSCCLMNNPQPPGQGPGAGKQPPPNDEKAKGKQGRGGGFANALSAQAAAWAPNPMNPPKYFDLPTKDGQLQPLIAAKWVANSPLVMVDQYVPKLKQYGAIAMDVGLQDPLLTTNTQLHEALTRLGIQHTFETYEGTHMSAVKSRFAAKVLPFFGETLIRQK
jgi:enterochelin esterase-like enzyme